MKKYAYKSGKMSFWVFALMIFLLGGCQKFEKIQETNLSGNDYDAKGVVINSSGTNCTDIMAGQTTDAGDVCLDDIDTDSDGVVDALQITYNTENGWELLEIHYAVSISFSDLPTTKKGNLIPGQFPYADENIPAGLTSYTLTIPFTDIDYTCGDDGSLYAAAHCVVGIPDGTGGYTQTETGWGEGQDPEGGNWAMYFMFTISCDPDDPPQTPDGCETAFAFGGDFATCFIGADFDGDGIDDGFNRWGWSNGPLAAGTYTFEIWSGAGQCNTANGYNTGYLTLEYDGAQAIVTFNMYGDNTMDETHLYVGNDPLPTNNGEYTVAPGQYPFIHGDLNGASTDSYTIDNLSGDIYVVAHAVVCGMEGPPACDEWIVYGNNLGTSPDPYGVGGDEDDIFAVDLNQQSISLLYDSDISRSDQNYPNGNAYDPDNQWLYYATNDGYIIVYNMTTGLRSNGLKDPSNPETRSIACGAYYNGSYYYIPQGTDDLIKATVSFDGIGTWSLVRQDLGSISGTSNRSFSFGDIVFDINNPGLLLGSASSGGQAYFFKYNLNTGTYSDYVKSSHLQLAYASNGALYGLNATTGSWYEVDPDTGNETLFWENSGIYLTDLANGPQCQ